MSSIGVEFLNDVPPESCHHYITDLSLAANTYLKADSYGGTNYLGGETLFGTAGNKIMNGLGIYRNTIDDKPINIG